MWLKNHFGHWIVQSQPFSLLWFLPGPQITQKTKPTFWFSLTNCHRCTNLIQANHTTPHFTFSLGPFPQCHTCCSESLFNCTTESSSHNSASFMQLNPLYILLFSLCLLTPPSNVVVVVVVCKTNLNQLYSSINHYRAIGIYFLKATYISDVVF